MFLPVKRKTRIKLIKIKKILSNPTVMRKSSLEDIEDIKESIKINGILQPLTVWENEEGILELIAGERRIMAARLLGMTKVPCIKVNTTREKAERISVEINLKQKPIEKKELIFSEI